MLRLALANTRFPKSPSDSLGIVLDAMASAAARNAAIVCFAEGLVPGYRLGASIPPPDTSWLESAWKQIDQRAGELGLGVILGTERQSQAGLHLTARVTGPDGALCGFQDKVQLDPSEESTYSPGSGRRVFRCAGVTFGVVICHEGWRYPETVRWAVRQGAQIVFHPHVEVVEDQNQLWTRFADPANTFHEKAMLCRAAENTCYFASVNCALPGASTTSAVIDPEGVLIAHQPYGEEGILVAEIDPAAATGLLAKRLRPDALSTDEQ
ncbi:MAG: carbon-nitrogen hydrolase family protein [Planctomycetota bacterium]